MLQRREFWCTHIMPLLATSSLKSLHIHNRSGLSPARRGILISMEEPRPRLPGLAEWYEEVPWYIGDGRFGIRWKCNLCNTLALPGHVVSVQHEVAMRNACQAKGLRLDDVLDGSAPAPPASPRHIVEHTAAPAVGQTAAAGSAAAPATPIAKAPPPRLPVDVDGGLHVARRLGQDLQSYRNLQLRLEQRVQALEQILRWGRNNPEPWHAGGDW